MIFLAVDIVLRTSSACIFVHLFAILFNCFSIFTGFHPVVPAFTIDVWMLEFKLGMGLEMPSSVDTVMDSRIAVVRRFSARIGQTL